MRKSFLFQAFIQIFCLPLIFIFLSSSAWADLSPVSTLSSRVESILKSAKVDGGNLGLVVTRWDDGKIQFVHRHRSDQKMIPASLTKVFTAGAVIDQLSSGHRFKTTLGSNAKIKEGVLQGDLFLKGGGDPSFVSENLWFLVNEFTRTGIHKISGNIVVDDTLFDRDFFPGRPEERVDRAYDAPIGAMSFNWNSVNIFLRPGSDKKSSAQVVIDPVNEFVKLINKATTGSKNSYKVSRAEEPHHDIISVSGSVALGAAEKAVYKSITQPSIWSGSNLASFLKQRNIEFKGKVLRGKAPADSVVLAEAESKPLAQILADLMKFSNNYVAEMLTKNLAVSQGEVGNNEGGLKAIRSYIKRLGYSDKDFSMVNASGLSRDNQFTVEQLAAALNQLRGRFDVSPEFITSLPIAGVDGTLKSRMNNTPADRWVRAKTGLLSGVVGLAGYSGRADGDVLTFAFLYNGRVGQEPHIRQLFDRLAVELVK